MSAVYLGYASSSQRPEEGTTSSGTRVTDVCKTPVLEICLEHDLPITEKQVFSSSAWFIVHALKNGEQLTASKSNNLAI